MAKKERHSLTRLTASLWSEIQAERKVTPQGGTADHTRETYLGGEEVRAKGVVGWQREGQGGRGRDRERYNRAEAPFARCSGTTTLRHIDFTGSLALTLGRPVH